MIIDPVPPALVARRLLPRTDQINLTAVDKWRDHGQTSTGSGDCHIARPHHTLDMLFGTQLSGTVHGDPADGILLATATMASCPWLPADRLIPAYAQESPLFSVCDVRP